MPLDEEGMEYVEAVLDHLEDLSSDEENDDVEFLTDYLKQKGFQNLIEAYDILTSKVDPDEPVRQLQQDAVSAHEAVLGDLNGVLEKSEELTELYELLTSPHVTALVQVFDDVMYERFEPQLDESAMLEEDGMDQHSDRGPPSELTSVTDSTTPARGSEGFTKTIALRKGPDETLGITVVRQEYRDGTQMRSAIVVERILRGSVIDRQSLLHVGDIIQEVNDQPIDTPEALQRLMKQHSSGTVVFKIFPAYQRQVSSDKKVYMRTFFNYDPSKDSLIPCRDAGLAFDCGEILEIMNQDDVNWWQARRLGAEGPHAGLVPSQMLEERRKSFRPMSDEYLKNYSVCGPFGKRNSKKRNVHIYRASDAPNNFQDSDVLIYEEVHQVPPGRVPVIVLVGARGVGRRAVKRALVQHHSDVLAQPVTWTTRSLSADPAEMTLFRHVDRDEMESAARAGGLIEFGRDGPDLYGVAFDAVREVVRSGRTAVIDCQPQTIRLIRQGEFRPFVVFLAAPAVDVQRAMYQYGLKTGLTRQMRTDETFKKTMIESCAIERAYRHMFDFMLLNDSIEKTSQAIANRLSEVNTEPRWVPVHWAMEFDESLLLTPA